MASAQVLPTGEQGQARADARAHAYYDAGSAAYEAGDYETALTQFRRAFAASGRPELHYNIGQAAERAGQLRTAIRSFDRFVAEVPDSPRRPEVQRNLLLLRENAEEQGIVVDPPDGTPELADTPADSSTPGFGYDTTSAPTPAETAAAADLEQAPDEPSQESVVESPWLWAGLVAAVAGGVVLAIFLSQDSVDVDAHGDGTLGTATALGVAR